MDGINGALDGFVVDAAVGLAYSKAMEGCLSGQIIIVE